MNWNGSKRFWHRAISRTIGIMLIFGLTAFLYLSTQGIPKRIVDRWLGQLRAQGYCVAVERIRLDLLAGIVAEQFRAFEDQDAPQPILQAEQVVLFLNPLDWLRSQAGLRRLHVYNGRLRLSLAENTPGGDSDTIVVRNVNGDVRFSRDAWQIADLSADLFGLKINCRGLIRLPRTADTQAQPSATSPASASGYVAPIITNGATHSQQPDQPNTAPVTRRLGDLTRSQRKRLLELIEQLNAFQFTIPPHAEIVFELNTEKPETSAASIRMEGAGTRAFGVLFDQWRLQASLKDGRLCVTEAQLQQRGQYLACSGSYTFAERMIAARLSGRAILQDWLILAPAAWRQALDQTGLSIEGPVQCSIALAPAPINQALEHLSGWLALAQTDAQGVWIEQGLVGFEIGSDDIIFDPIAAVLGRERPRGIIEGQGSYNPATGDYEAQLESNLDPRLLTPALTSNQAVWVIPAAFQGPPPSITLAAWGRAGRADSIRLTGQIQAASCSYNAIPVESAAAHFEYSAGVLSFNPLRLTRREGAVAGRLTAPLDQSVISLDLASTADPLAIARLIGPDLAAYLEGFHFAGPMRIAARGCIDYDTGALTDIQADLDGANWGYAPFHANRCSFTLAIKGLRCDLTNIRGEAYEGTFTGQAAIYPAGAATNFGYHLQGRVDDLNLNTLLQSMGYQGREEYEGLIYAECVLAGAIGEGRGDTAAGGGWLRIQDGQLYHLRLLGGFSRLLSIIDPGLGIVNLTDFAANFTIQDRKIETSDAVLSGQNLAIHTKGYYGFDEHLDFIVWLQPHERKTLLPRLTQATAPVLTKLLTVRLTGTVSDPKWWPLNLTKDQLLALPKDLLITMPKDVLIGLPKDVLVTLPREVLVTLPKELLIDLPEEIFIKLPQDIWNSIKHLRPAKAKSGA